MSSHGSPQGGAVPSEDEVRALVAAVIAEVTAEQPERQPASGGSHEDAAPAPAAPAGVAVGADHGGYRLKERIVSALREQGLDVRDCGTDSTDSVDYPEYAHRVARLVADGNCRWGVVVDGAGIGSCMVANKVPGVRAATCWDISSARNSREHNHANVLALGAGLVGESLALQIVEAWLGTPWGGDRHARRVEQIAEIERRYLASPVGATR